MPSAVASIVTSLASAAVSTIFTKKADNKNEQAFEAREEAAQVQSAAEKNRDRVNRRKANREARVKRAAILASQSTSGVSNTSGAAGATGALSTNLNSALGFQSGQAKASEGVTNLNIQAGQFDREAQKLQLKGDIFSGLIEAGGSALSSGLKAYNQ